MFVVAMKKVSFAYQKLHFKIYCVLPENMLLLKKCDL